MKVPERISLILIHLLLFDFPLVSGGPSVVSAAGRVPDVRGECRYQYAGTGAAVEPTDNCKRHRSGSFADFSNMGARTIPEWSHSIIRVADCGPSDEQ